MTFDATIVNLLVICLVSIGLDFVMGVLLSIKNGEFSINKLPQTIATNVLPYMGGLIVLALAGNFVAAFNPVFMAAAGFVVLKFGKEALIDKIKLWLA